MTTTDTSVSLVQSTAAQEDKRLYKSAFRFGSYIFPSGRAAHFKGGMYVTGDKDEIDHLDDQIRRNAFNGAIYIDPTARTISAEQENPLLALRKKYFAEFLLEQQQQMRVDNDMGTSEQGALKPASTSDIAAVSAGGDGNQMSAKLMELAKNIAAGTSTAPVKVQE